MSAIEVSSFESFIFPRRGRNCPRPFQTNSITGLDEVVDTFGPQPIKPGQREGNNHSLAAAQGTVSGWIALDLCHHGTDTFYTLVVLHGCHLRNRVGGDPAPTCPHS